MEAIKDFLLEYYVWVLAVLVILLITIIGFLADTKRKKKLREKSGVVGNTSSNLQNNNTNINQNMVMDQSMNMNPNIDRNIGMNPNINLNNQNISNDYNQQNNSNDPFNSNVNGVNNNFEQATMNVNNNPFFIQNQNEEPQVIPNNIAPTPIEAVPIANQMGNIPAAVVEPTEVTNFNNQNMGPTPVVEPMQQVQVPYSNPSVQVEMPNQMLDSQTQNIAPPVNNQMPDMANQSTPVQNNVQIPVMPNQDMVVPNNTQMPNMPSQSNMNQMNNGNWQV